MSLKGYIHTIILLLLFALQAQAQGIHSHQESVKDTNTIKHFLGKGTFKGHARSYWSATVNEGSLTDYYAWGVGAGIGYETPRFLKRLQVGMSGYFMFNLLSSDLAKTDPLTNQANRYEVGLFDIERPNDHEDLDRLEELYAKVYITKKSLLTVGRQIPYTPFVNPQDGRMRPTLIEGATLELNEWRDLKLYANYTWRISPRSTVRWFDVAESVGIYPVGVGTDGKPAQYKGVIDSKGLGIVGLKYQKKQWDIQLWDTHFDNVLNTLQLKTEWKSEAVGKRNWLLGIQATRQWEIGNGGNTNPLKAYKTPHENSTVVSARFGRQSPRFDWFLNATRISREGRFLMPREWGREPFYTFMPRERNEGMGDVNAATINTYFKPQKHIKVELSGGYFQLPDVRNFRLNKYGMPSYSQVNLGITYEFTDYLKGLHALLLVVRKDEVGETYQSDRYVFNKVNMTHFNFILNYHY